MDRFVAVRERFVVVPAVHVLLVRGERVLLARRHNTGYEDGKWSVPAGHLDGDESVRAAAVREAEEEVGIQLSTERVRFGHVMHRRKPDEERVDFFVVSEQWGGEAHIAEPNKCSELMWANPQALPSDTIPYVRRGIELTFRREPYSEFGW
jgi:8-oxo-dGTP pyrophosphatase MutT (NUDIX family)